MKGPLVFYRLLFLFLNSFLAYKLARRVLFEFQKSSVPLETILKIDWKSINLKEPPKLHSAEAERLRLNEFLAAKHYDCKDSLRLGDGSEKFILCGEFKPFRSAASISGDKLASGELERQLGAEKWILFTPEGSQVVDKLSGDVEVNYFTELAEWDHWHTWDMEQVLRGRRLGVAKIDLYTHFFRSSDQPDVIRKLVPMMDARQLLLTMEIGKEGELVAKWYQLLFWLFFEQKYSLVGAIPNGVCGAEPRNCRYRVSLARVDENDVNTAPVFGMGSPLEEYRRLVKFLKENSTECSEIAETSNFPKFCGNFVSEAKTVIYVTYKQWDASFLPHELSHLTSFYLVSPFEPNGKTKRIVRLPWIISDRSSSSDSIYVYKSLDAVLDASGGNDVDLLILDIEGGEWEMLPQLVENIDKFNQISVRGKIFPEENENYRRFYWLLHRITMHGFESKLSRVNLPDFSLIFVKSSVFYG